MARTEKRILIVDDDDGIRTLVQTILRRRGYAVDTARNGIEALERLEERSYGLMLLDLMMPQMSGWEMLRLLGSRTPNRRPPVIILLTAGPESREVSPELVAGAVRKPFDIDLLTDTVSEWIGPPPAARPIDASRSAESDSAGLRG